MDGWEDLEDSGYFALRTRKNLQWVGRFLVPADIDLTGYYAIAEARAHPEANGDPLFRLTSSPAAGLTFGDDGGPTGDRWYIDMVVSADDLADVPPLRHGSFQLVVYSGGDIPEFGFHCDDWVHRPGAIA